MNKSRVHELGKDRVAQIRMADIFNHVVIGILTIWAIWVLTSLLIRFIR